jgi:uncharacterized protein YjiS (DUF1127 family)
MIAIAEMFCKYKEFFRTLKRYQNMSDDELADKNLNRQDITKAALEKTWND